jgi:uncharacterized membrane protein YqjE
VYLARHDSNFMPLAVMLSLPLVMLCWALLSFVVGVMIWISSHWHVASAAVVGTTFSLLVCAVISGFVFFRDIQG